MSQRIGNRTMFINHSSDNLHLGHGASCHNCDNLPPLTVIGGDFPELVPST